MEIKAGELVVFVGPSGCGKSTTLKMINRLIEPTSGRIRIGDEDVTDMDPVKLRRKIGYAIQSSGLFPHMTVAQNIALVPKMVGLVRKPRSKDRVEEMLDLVGLDPGEFHGRYPRQLSGGQQQRVGVARALAADPPVLLMDEPFGAVDPITRDHLQDELIRLQHELHKTICFVTHDFDEAIKLGDRIAVLRERSHIAQFDTPEAILTNPADDFVSGFVGAGAALKRLNLTRVRDVAIVDFPTASMDDPLQSIFDLLRSGSSNEVLLLDRNRRPYKWLRRGDLSRAKDSLARAGTPVHDTVTRDATLRDALEAVLTDNAGPGRGHRAARRVHRRGRHGDADEQRPRAAGGRPPRRRRAPARTPGAAGPPDPPARRRARTARTAARGSRHEPTRDERQPAPGRTAPGRAADRPDSPTARTTRSRSATEREIATGEAPTRPAAARRPPDQLAEVDLHAGLPGRPRCSPPGCGSAAPGWTPSPTRRWTTARCGSRCASTSSSP